MDSRPPDANPNRSPAAGSHNPTDERAAIDKDALPQLTRDRAFAGMTVTQLLGAFNDNLFKQLVLLLMVGFAVAGGDGESRDLQPLAMAVFSLPFVLFSGFAGFLSDRYNKRTIIILAKVAEIVIMLLGIAAFMSYDRLAAAGHTSLAVAGLLGVLFLLGSQSAFFGPSKYGILPEMLRGRDLPAANGAIQMTTFLAIIFGTASAGYLMDAFDDRLWIGSEVCVLIAVIGTATSLLVRRVPVAQPQLEFRVSSLGIPPEIIGLLKNDSTLWWTLIVYALFWLIGGLVQPSVNSLGEVQLGLSELKTSLMVAGLGAGIAIGCVAAGLLSRGQVRFGLVRAATWAVVACLILLSLRGGANDQWLGYAGSCVVLIALGCAAGMMAVPLQVFLQARPPAHEKGRMIATQNLISWIAIFLSAGIYAVFDLLLAAFEWPRNQLFALTAVLLVPVALFFRPHDEQL